MAAPEYESYYRVIRTIPQGRVMTYGDVAIAAGRPRQARRVGYALHALRGGRVPWWRVINAMGRISARGRSDHGDEQRVRLEAEGIDFGLGGTIDLDVYRHHPKKQKGARRPPST
ncbi:MAG: cysteine methyltransferase [Alphaproteobacteria bacterium]|nr:cysteine methyltransferase [Alphaproteobacteria bacterium]